MSDLTICKLSDCSATVAGGREIILLCEKVAKEDIQVRFYEERDGELYWEALGDFQPTHVHKQVAISFRTPKYKNIDVDKPVKVWVQLRRPSDGAVSESVPFQFVPLDSGRATFWSLRRALSKKGDYNTFSNILTMNTALLTGNGRSVASPEPQKRKLEALTPVVLDEFSESKKPLIEREPEDENKKDALISGGNLVVLPTPQLTVYEKEPKVLGLETVPVPVPVPAPEKEPENNFDLDERNNNNVQNETEKKSVEEELMVVEEKEDILKETEEIQNENSQSFNDLITQVAELDEIYSETQNRLVLTREELEGQLEDVAMDCRELFDDSQTYSSLQLAMKNPIDLMEMRSYEDVTPVQGPIIDIKSKASEISSEKLPPLPPKRVKKTPPRRPDASPPSKDLPKTPDNIKSKQNIFQKLFSKNKKIKEKSSSSESLKFGSRNSLTNLSFKESDKKSLEDVSVSVSVSPSSPKNTENVFSKWFHRGSTGNIPDTKTPVDEDKSVVKENIKNNNESKETGFLEDFDINKSDLDLGLDLTEAENYALYTSMAPHASVSEFDEMSFYYSPVEGGKILTQEQYEKRIRSDVKNINKPQNVPS